MDLERLEERLLTLLPHSLDLVEQKRQTLESLRESEFARLESAGGTQSEVHDHMRSQLEAWLLRAMPDIENRSPLECVGNSEQMRLVLDQLKAFENRESRNPMHAGGRYDFTWVWTRLGLETDHP